MGKIVSASAYINTTASGFTSYFPISDGNASGTSVSSIYTRQLCRTAGTFSNLRANVVTNSRTAGPILCKLAINGSFVNNNLSISAGSTGLFEDLTSTDTISSGDYYEGYCNIPTGTGTFLCIQIDAVLNLTGAYKKHFASYVTGGTTLSTASTVRYIPIVGNHAQYTTESDAQAIIPVAGVMSNVRYAVNSNLRTTTTTLRSRINSANGNQSVSITSGVTGFIEDTSNTDTLAAGDLICMSLTTLTGTQGITGNGGGCLFAPTSNDGFPFMGQTSGAANASTFYVTIMGATIGSTGESTVDYPVPLAGTFSKMSIRVSLNSSTATTTIRFRVAAAAGNQSVSVTSGATGSFRDTTNSDNVTAGQNVDYQISGQNASITVKATGIYFVESSGGSTYNDSVSLGGIGQNAHVVALVIDKTLTFGGIAGNAEAMALFIEKAQTLGGIEGISHANSMVIEKAQTFGGVAGITESSSMVIEKAQTYGGIAGVTDTAELVIEKSVTVGGVAGISHVNDMVINPTITLSGVGSVSIAPLLIFDQSITAAAAAGILCGNGANYDENVSFGGIAGNTEAATVVITGTITVTNIGGISHANSMVIEKAVTLNAAGALAFVNSMVRELSITLAGTGTISEASNLSYENALTLACGAGIVTAGQYVIEMTATIAGRGSVAVGSVMTMEQLLSIASTGSYSGAGAVVIETAATVAGAAGITAAAGLVLTDSISMAGVAGIDASAGMVLDVSSVFGALGGLSINNQTVLNADITLNVTAAADLIQSFVDLISEILLVGYGSANPVVSGWSSADPVLTQFSSVDHAGDAFASADHAIDAFASNSPLLTGWIRLKSSQSTQ